MRSLTYGSRYSGNLFLCYVPDTCHWKQVSCLPILILHFHSRPQTLIMYCALGTWDMYPVSPFYSVAYIPVSDPWQVGVGTLSPHLYSITMHHVRTCLTGSRYPGSHWYIIPILLWDLGAGIIPMLGSSHVGAGTLSPHSHYTFYD